MKQKVHTERTVITNDLILKMQDDRDAGMTVRGIAAKYDVGRTTVIRHTFAPEPLERYNGAGENDMFVEKSPHSYPSSEWRSEWDTVRLEVLRKLK